MDARTLLTILMALSGAAANGATFAGGDLPVSFERADEISSEVQDAVLADVEAYFAMSDGFRAATDNGRLVPRWLDSILLRNPAVETNLTFAVSGGTTNCLVSFGLSSLYAAIPDFAARTNLIHGARLFADALRRDAIEETGVSNREALRAVSGNGLRGAEPEEMSDEALADAFREMSESFDFFTPILVELEQASNGNDMVWSVLVRYRRKEGADRTIMASRLVFLDGRWRIVL